MGFGNAGADQNNQISYQTPIPLVSVAVRRNRLWAVSIGICWCLQEIYIWYRISLMTVLHCCCFAGWVQQHIIYFKAFWFSWKLYFIAADSHVKVETRLRRNIIPKRSVSTEHEIIWNIMWTGWHRTDFDVKMTPGFKSIYKICWI
jgi:hypothetical protein